MGRIERFRFALPELLLLATLLVLIALPKPVSPQWSCDACYPWGSFRSGGCDGLYLCHPDRCRIDYCANPYDCNMISGACWYCVAEDYCGDCRVAGCTEITGCSPRCIRV